jgi:hypothetical protein
MGDRGLEPLSPDRKWRAIALATLLLAPATWSLLIGLVALASDDEGGPTDEAAAGLVALGLSLIPFVFVLLAFASEHPRAPGAAARAMGWCLLVGLPASAVAGDAVTGIVAGVGAGGVAALRIDAVHDRRLRAWAVVAAAAYAFVLARGAGAVVLVAAPALPLTALGLADHLAEWRLQRARSDPA